MHAFYGKSHVLHGVNFEVRAGEIVALLGRNGQGKSTLSKLLSNRLVLFEGKQVNSNKLRIGFFAQHQVDELMIDETPLQHMIAARPGIMQPKLRAQLAGFGLGPDQADTAVGRLSGGQKARLSLLLATL